MVVKFHHVALDKIILNTVLGEGVNDTWTAVMSLFRVFRTSSRRMDFEIL